MALTTRSLLAAALLVGVAAPAVAQLPANESERIAGLWEQRRKAVSTAEYKLTWEWFPTHLETGGQKLSENGGYIGKGTVLIDFENNRIRFEREEIRPDDIWPSTNYRLLQRRVFADDGLNRYYTDHIERILAPSQPAQVVRSYSQMDRPIPHSWTDVGDLDPIFWAHGLVQMETPRPDVYQPMRWRPTAAQVQPVGSEEIDGKPCAIVRVPNRRIDALYGMKDSLLVENQMTGRVLQYRRSGLLEKKLDISYRDTPYGSFPEGWTVNRRRAGEPLTVSHSFRIESAAYNRSIPEDEFRIKYPPGTMVYKPDGWYRTQKDGRLLRRLDLLPVSYPSDRPGWFKYLPDWLSNRLVIAARWADWRMTIGPLSLAVLGVLYARHRRLRAATADV